MKLLFTQHSCSERERCSMWIRIENSLKRFKFWNKYILQQIYYLTIHLIHFFFGILRKLESKWRFQGLFHTNWGCGQELESEKYQRPIGGVIWRSILWQKSIIFISAPSILLPVIGPRKIIGHRNYVQRAFRMKLRRLSLSNFKPSMMQSVKLSEKLLVILKRRVTTCMYGLHLKMWSNFTSCHVE